MKLRFCYLALWVLIVILGLGSRTYGDYLPSFVATYAGDTLWAAMVYWGISFLFPLTRLLRRVTIALLFSYCIEVSQLYQSDWINAIRGTTLGALILGHGFLWSDMLCYTIGVGLAALTDFFLTYKRK
ncbi:DUF2809 domain-containing protein [Bacteroides sp. K03]|uniref:ribosomal maturation YjgA family protein n=1 Tax=Bacteroides TaxID=816 RepID=UPI001C8C0D13|nr:MULTISPECIES: DUF2809 domain-containing protein [Bacteroides]MBX9189113.1 DUF2809 domain-containing protein [Bacteroides sp. K03]